jgi:hypothetical protein
MKKVYSSVFPAVFAAAVLMGCNSGGGIHPTVQDVSVTPSRADVSRGGTAQFEAAAIVSGGAAEDVAWSIDETPAGAATGISSTGLLTIDDAETLSALTVRAASTAAGFTHVSGAAAVTVSAPFDVWLLGPGTPAGYTLMHASTKMTDTGSGVYTWTGALTAHTSGVQFSTNKTGTPAWNAGTWYHALSGETISPGTAQPVSETDNSESYFTISAAAAGNYTITLDTQARTVLFTPDPAVNSVTGIYGEAAVTVTAPYVPTGPGFSIYGVAAAGSTWLSGPSLTETAAGVYTWTGACSTGQLKFRDTTNNRDWAASTYTSVESGRTYPAAHTMYNQLFNLTAAGNYTITLNVDLSPGTGTATFVKN